MIKIIFYAFVFYGELRSCMGLKCYLHKIEDMPNTVTETKCPPNEAQCLALNIALNFATIVTVISHQSCTAEGKDYCTSQEAVTSITQTSVDKIFDKYLADRNFYGKSQMYVTVLNCKQCSREFCNSRTNWVPDGVLDKAKGEDKILTEPWKWETGAYDNKGKGWGSGGSGKGGGTGGTGKDGGTGGSGKGGVTGGSGKGGGTGGSGSSGDVGSVGGTGAVGGTKTGITSGGKSDSVKASGRVGTGGASTPSVSYMCSIFFIALSILTFFPRRGNSQLCQI